MDLIIFTKILSLTLFVPTSSADLFPNHHRHILSKNISNSTDVSSNCTSGSPNTLVGTIQSGQKCFFSLTLPANIISLDLEITTCYSGFDTAMNLLFPNGTVIFNTRDNMACAFQRNKEKIYYSNVTANSVPLSLGNTYIIELTGNNPSLDFGQYTLNFNCILRTANPTRSPTTVPTSYPTFHPVPPPTSQPTSQPTSEPSIQPTPQPTMTPTTTPTTTPTMAAQSASQVGFNPLSTPILIIVVGATSCCVLFTCLCLFAFRKELSSVKIVRKLTDTMTHKKGEDVRAFLHDLEIDDDFIEALVVQQRCNTLDRLRYVDESVLLEIGMPKLVRNQLLEAVKGLKEGAEGYEVSRVSSPFQSEGVVEGREGEIETEMTTTRDPNMSLSPKSTDGETKRSTMTQSSNLESLYDIVDGVSLSKNRQGAGSEVGHTDAGEVISAFRAVRTNGMSEVSLVGPDETVPEAAIVPISTPRASV